MTVIKTPSLRALAKQSKGNKYRTWIAGLFLTKKPAITLVFMLAFFLLFTPSTAHAVCANPAGTEGKVIYNATHKVAQFCNGTNWIGMAGGRTSTAGDTMVTGWPDAIVCGNYVLYSRGNSDYTYRDIGDTANRYVLFNSDGSYNTAGLPDASCTSKSIAQLYTDGQAFNFIGGQGASADNLGNHTATTNIVLGANYLSGDGGNEGVYVDASGNVGIGTATPAFTNNAAWGRLVSVESGTTTGSAMSLGASVAGTTDYLGGYNFHNTSIGGVEKRVASIVGRLGGATNSGHIEFYTANAGSWVRAMDIQPNGNVGIGTNVPAAKLTVNGPSTGLTHIGVLSDATANGGIGFSSTLTSTNYALAGTGSYTLLNVPTGGYIDLRQNNVSQLTINSSGNVGIGMTPTNKLHVGGNIGATGWIGAGCEIACETSGGYALLYANGTIVATSTVTASAYYQSSDQTLKTDIQTIDNPFALLKRIEGKYFKWKKDNKGAYGVIAQDVETVMPDAVGVNADGTKTVEYSQLIAPLIEAVKQLEARVNALETENKKLKEVQ